MRLGLTIATAFATKQVLAISLTVSAKPAQDLILTIRQGEISAQCCVIISGSLYSNLSGTFND